MEAARIGDAEFDCGKELFAKFGLRGLDELGQFLPGWYANQQSQRGQPDDQKGPHVAGKAHCPARRAREDPEPVRSGDQGHEQEESDEAGADPACQNEAASPAFELIEPLLGNRIQTDAH